MHPDVSACFYRPTFILDCMTKNLQHDCSKGPLPMKATHTDDAVVYQEHNNTMNANKGTALCVSLLRNRRRKGIA